MRCSLRRNRGHSQQGPETPLPQLHEAERRDAGQGVAVRVTIPHPVQRWPVFRDHKEGQRRRHEAEAGLRSEEHPLLHRKLHQPAVPHSDHRTDGAADRTSQRILHCKNRRQPSLRSFLHCLEHRSRGSGNPVG